MDEDIMWKKLRENAERLKGFTTVINEITDQAELPPPNFYKNIRWKDVEERMDTFWENIRKNED